ncbi:hypothetical protein M5C97_16735 [Acidovorax sp. NCPPB 3859]|nr:MULTISPECIES: hypothetical protein [unclassified Acidovorax]MDA8450630.1 hypothetical protein [Acidovorax sp. GBBC 3297]MDA8460003.1 hypothetical protein [Acidovorax sp. GBBC 3333]MDA8465039.1 hypothetical protein [Acidovorax sp. GBBC 3332]MDA8470145.1 hypothetical protein [Acidovorax sp. GBBC 3299]WCM77154.1 hypothetical protein M5C94_16690 [Acidovorax sp. GBBC 712]
MKLFLPYSIGSRDIDSLFSLANAVEKSDSERIELDASRVEFIDPQGLAVLGAMMSRHSTRKFSMPWLPVKTAGYMARMDFFRHFDIDAVDIPNWGRRDHRDSLVELTCVTDHHECDSTANALADAITGTLTEADPNANPNKQGRNQFDNFRHPIWYSLSELLENSLTHARQRNFDASVWIASQYYPGSGIVKMAVVDNGCGMLATLTKHPQLREQTHEAAISTALLPRVSCNRDGTLYSTHANQGVGLTTTARIARAARGTLHITSGDACVHSRTGKSTVFPRGYWRGVAIGFECRRAQLPAIRLRDLLPPEETSFGVNFEE